LSSFICFVLENKGWLCKKYYICKKKTIKMTTGIKITMAFALMLVLSAFCVQAQQKQWTLEECISYAKEHNLSIKLQQYNLDISKYSLLQSKGMILPSVSGYASHSYNYGQTVDRFTNQFASDMVQSNNFYVSANLTLFNGFQLLNSVHQSRYELQAAQYDLEMIENDIALTIATAYLQILYSMEMLENAKNQYALTMKQVDRTQKMLDAGAVANTSLLNLKAQAASEEYQLTTLETQLDMAILTMTQLLDLENSIGFTIVIPIVDVSEMTVPMDAQRIYEYAMNHQPSVKSAELRVLSAQKSYSIAKGRFSPSLTFGASLGTGYSGASRQLTGFEYAGMDTIGITAAATPDYVLAPVFNYLYEPVSFMDQIDQNFNRSIAFNLSIPIFSSLQTYSNVRRSKISVYMAEANLQQTRQNLNKTINQAHLDAVSAYKRYFSAQKQVEAAKEVFKVAEQRFELDDLTLLEYQDAKNKLIQAESELLQSKYEFVFKMKVLDFYLGNEIKL
jgi:outer membrane protein